jgi:hypothetical protein
MATFAYFQAQVKNGILLAIRNNTVQLGSGKRARQAILQICSRLGRFHYQCLQPCLLIHVKQDVKDGFA